MSALHPLLAAAQSTADPEERAQLLDSYRLWKARQNIAKKARETLDEYYAAISRIAELFPDTTIISLGQEVKSYLDPLIKDLPLRDRQTSELLFLQRLIAHFHEHPQQARAIQLFNLTAKLLATESPDGTAPPVQAVLTH